MMGFGTLPKYLILQHLQSLAGPAFTGSLQEWRYYATQSSQDTFNAYVMNPSSIEESRLPSFQSFTLGGELYTSSISIHPKVSGVQATTSSFPSTSTYFTTKEPLYYIPNTEVVFYDQVLGGIKNIVSEKIKIGEFYPLRYSIVGNGFYAAKLSCISKLYQRC
jgi:hypothetical protein